MSTLTVSVSGRRVGTLEYFDEAMSDYVLTFDEARRNDPDRPILGQIFEDMAPRSRSLPFSVLVGNGDAHLKNWAICYPDGRHARLAPAYDLVATVVYPRRLCADELALSLANSRRFEDVTVRSFDALARFATTPVEEVARWVRETAEKVREAWSLPETRDRFSADERARIDAHHSRVSS